VSHQQHERALGNLARDIIRVPLYQERMRYLAAASEIVYRPKDGTKKKVFDALEWLAAMFSKIRDRGGTVGAVLTMPQLDQRQQFNW
jgi:hypothetical protein